MTPASQVDPSLARTLLVASKFDNRLKEFSSRWEVDRYLSASGFLPPGVRPFFVALPKVRARSAWRGAGVLDGPGPVQRAHAHRRDTRQGSSARTDCYSDARTSCTRCVSPHKASP